MFGPRRTPAHLKMNDASIPYFRPVVVAPTYNNARTLPRVLEALGATELEIFVVNDGCEDASASVLQQWIDSADQSTQRIVLTHDRNRGKAAALHTGFARARELDFTHAITIDTDGQHDVADVAPLVKIAHDNPAALVIGARSTFGAYPFASRLGRTISNLLIGLESGAKVQDSQCGLRVYPLDATLRLKRGAGRFGYETEIITRFAWAGLPIIEAPIRCIYEVEGGRTTHFSIGRDSASAVLMHVGLLARSLLFIPPEKLGQHDHTGTIVERFLRWINPMRVWRQIRADHAERKRFASSFATGIFIATLPPFGLKTIVCLLLSKWFRLQPVVVVGASSLNTPPIGTVLAAMSIVTGHLLLNGRWPALSRYDPFVNGMWNTLKSVGVEWIVGSLVLGAILAAISYLILRLAFRAAPLARPHAPAESA